MTPPPKLLAEWFWTDRWIGSSAFGLPLEARGLYREMLTQAWRRGASLPNDPDQVRRMAGVTKSEWRRSWPLVERFWRVDGDALVPVESDLGFSKPLPGQTQHRPHVPLEVRRAVFGRDEFACVICADTDLLELDHVVPFSRGGSDTVENLRLLCKPCNRRKGASL